MSTEKTPTPELNKVRMLQSKSQAVGDFLEYLGEKGLVICRYASKEDEKETGFGGGLYYNEGDLIPILKSIEQMLADYFAIDLHKMELEKRAILDEINQENVTQESSIILSKE
jgi:hypothetical protein